MQFFFDSLDTIQNEFAPLWDKSTILTRNISPAEKQYAEIGWAVIIYELAGSKETEWEAWLKQSIEHVFNILLLQKTKAICDAKAREWHERKEKKSK